MSLLLTEQLYVADWLKGESENPNKVARDQIVLENGGGAAITLITGTILSKNAGGHFVQLAPAATDGTQNVAGILGPTTIVPAGGTAPAWALTSWSGIVSDINITYPAGISSPQKVTAIQQLAALGIKVRRTA